MQVEFGISGATRYWITIFWFGLGAVILGVFAALSYWIRKCRKKPLKKKTNQNGGLRRSSSAIEFDASALTAANRRQMFSRNRSASSEQDNISDQSEHSEKSPLVSARLDNLAKLFFSKSMPSDTGSRDTIESVLTTRPNLKYQYSALDSGNGVIERSPRERAARDRALNACQEWVQNSNSRYEVIIHLDEIGSRHAKNWFLISDSSVRTDRLMSLLPLPPDCVALEELPPCESPKVILLELLGSLHHPYIYPVLDLGFLRTGSINYACLVTPFNSRGSLKDLIYKAQWNEPWNRKYTRKPYGLPTTQVQRLGRQILEALMFLKERGFPLHGHLHSGNVILQNGAARLSGLENGLLGLSSRVNAIMWSRSTTEIENIDIICFGHLLYEMCTGLELTTPKPSMNILEMDLERYPQILEILRLIFDPPGGVCPTVEELVLTDLFRSIDLRELRGPCISAMKPSLSRSTLNLLSAVKKRQTASLGNSLSETNSPCTPPSTPRDRRSARTVNSFNNISSDSEEGLLDEVIVATNRQHYHNHRLYNRQLQSNQHHHQYDPLNSPIHFCDSSIHSDDNSSQRQRQQQQSSVAVMVGGGGFVAVRSSSTSTMSTVGRTSVSMDGSCSSVGSTPTTIICQEGGDIDDEDDDGTDNGESSLSPVSLSPQQQQQHEHEQYTQQQQHQQQQVKVNSNSVPVSFATCSSSSPSSLSSSSAATNHSHPGASFNHQLTADICSYKNSKSRRLEYSLKCLKYGRSNPSQDSAFGSLTDGDLSIGSSSFRLSSFQSISSPIDEGVEDIIIATTSAGNETSLELATMPTSSIVSNDSAISTPCRDGSPNNFFTMDEPVPTIPAPSSMSSILPVTPATVATSVGAVTQTSSCIRPQQFPVSLSPKIFVTTTSNSSSSSISSATNLQFDPPKILVNDQNSIYTTSPSKRSGTIEVFSQKYRVCSFEDMSPSKRTQISSSNSSGKNHLKNVNRMAFRSLEEERRIDSAFMPIQDRTNSDNRVNINSEKYKKLTHSSFRISKTTSQMAVHEVANSSGGGSGSGGCTSSPASTTSIAGIGMCTIDGKKSNSSTSVSRQTMWRDSKFYRKNRIAKSNDSLLESSPNHSARLSPSSLRDNHYDSGHHSRQSLNRGCSANEISAAATNAGLNFGLCGLVVNQNFAGTSGRRYCSSKSEELCERNDSLRAIDSRMSYSERQLFTMSSKLKQTAITLTTTNISDQCFFSEDESFNDDNNQNQHQYQNQQQHHQQQHHQQQVHQNQKNHQQTTTTPHQLQHRQHNEHSNSICSHSHKHRQQQKQKLSFSTCSINSMSKTKTKTTSLATLPPYQNNLVGGGNGSSCSIISSSVQSVSEQRSSCNSIFKSLDDSLNFIDSRPVSDGDNDDDADADDGDNNSSADESPSRNIASISGIELSRIFNNDNALTHNSSCSEEKTPLLDSVELSPMSPIDTELNQM